MRALLCANPFELQLVDRPEPETQPGAAVVRLRRAGVCGTDLHIFEGTQPYFAYPRVIGHELSGEIAEAGPGSRFRAGQRVSIIPYVHCGHCVACRRGKTNCCQTLNVVGVHSDGGMADFLCMPDENLVEAHDVGLDEAAMVEFLAIGAHAARRGDAAPGQRALIVGAGPIGLATALFAKARGAETTALDSRDDRLAFARDAVGVDHVAKVGAETREQLAALTSGDFYDVVFDCTGSPKAMQAGFAYVAHGGAYVLVSIVLGEIAFNDPEFHKRETTLLGSRNATREDFDTVLDAIRAGLVPTARLNTHRASLSDAPAAFPEWIQPATGVIKALIEI